MDGRTRQVADAVACVRAWLAGADRERLVREVPFLDQKGRAIRALAARLDPRLRHDVGGDPYSCGFTAMVARAGSHQVRCVFVCACFLGQAPVAEAQR